MKLLVIVPLLLVVGLGTSSPTRKNKQPTITEYEKQTRHIKVNEPKEQREAEEKRLKAVEKEIEDHNAKPDATYTQKLSDFAEESNEDFIKQHGGLRRREGTRAMGLITRPESERRTPENLAKLAKVNEELAKMRDSIPDSFDSKDYGWVTTPKDQGTCGSCAAFASVGLFETSLAKVTGVTTGMDLSEQYLVDCAYEGDEATSAASGCNGATCDAYPKWFAANGGEAPHEDTYPYLGTSPKLNCDSAKDLTKYTASGGNKVIKYQYLASCSEDTMKGLVATKGAVLTAIKADDTAFQNFQTGVFNECSSSVQNHAVLAVGYGTENGQDYWLVKNSWGDSWGDSGYIKIARGSGMCGIGSECVTTDVGTEAEETEDTETSATCTLSDFSDLEGPYTFTWYSSDGTSIESTINCNDGNVCSVVTSTVASGTACERICGSSTC